VLSYLGNFLIISLQLEMEFYVQKNLVCLQKKNFIVLMILIAKFNKNELNKINYVKIKILVSF
jgi:hypothetical protein